MNRFFKIVLSNGETFVVASKHGYTGLIGLFDNVQDQENSYIIPISLFEFIKEVL